MHHVVWVKSSNRAARGNKSPLEETSAILSLYITEQKQREREKERGAYTPFKILNRTSPSGIK